jgi:flagellar protein FliS
MAYASRRPDATYSVRSYANVGMETQVLGATPQQLITLLFDGARAAIAQARLYMEQGQVAQRGKAIGRAIRLVDEGLKGSLDMNAGGELAENLSRLYDYIARTLLTANLKADTVALDTADRLLGDLRDAWQTATVDHSVKDAAQT